MSVSIEQIFVEKMSQYMRAKHLVEFRKRKREEREEEEAEESPRPLLTNAERMKQYRLRKKQAKEAHGVVSELVASVNPVAGGSNEPAVSFVLEPMPGRSTDPVRFRMVPVGGIAQDAALSSDGELTRILLSLQTKCFAPFVGNVGLMGYEYAV